jgi:hypothetical protein
MPRQKSRGRKFLRTPQAANTVNPVWSPPVISALLFDDMTPSKIYFAASPARLFLVILSSGFVQTDRLAHTTSKSVSSFLESFRRNGKILWLFSSRKLSTGSSIPYRPSESPHASR